MARGAGAALELLTLRRAPGARSAGSWETVHGTIEPGETPVAAARRELAEETGFVPERLYNLSRVESFYLHKLDRVVQGPGFVAFVAPDREAKLGDEHDLSEWLAAEAARARFAWPRERRAVGDLVTLLGGGDAGPLEDVLRVG
ncbi:MAG: NUDIX domain-containing protein [Gemmatimonadota bacterium]